MLLQTAMPRFAEERELGETMRAFSRLEPRKSRVYACGAILFAYGALLYWLLAERWIRWGFRPASAHAFINNPVTKAIVIFLGAISVTWLMLELLREMFENPSVRPVRALLRGGLYGIIATFATLEVFYVLAALFLAASIRPGLLGRNFLDTFVMTMISIETYGMVVIVYAIPLSFASGTVCGAVTLWMRRYIAVWPLELDKSKRMATAALSLGILGFLLSWLPFPGGILDVSAILFGVRTRRERGTSKRYRRFALAGVVFGTSGLVGLAGWLVGGYLIALSQTR